MEDQIRCSTQTLRAVGCEVVDAPQRADPPAMADVRYVSIYCCTTLHWFYMMSWYHMLHVQHHMTMQGPH